MSENGNGKLPYFPMYPADFLLDPKVQQMEPAPRAFYALSLFQAWLQNPPGSLPGDDKAIAKLLELSDECWAAIKDAVLSPFDFGPDGRWHQKRMELEYSKAVRFRVSRSEAGKKGNEERWHRKAIAQPSRSDRTAIARASDSPSSSDSVGVKEVQEPLGVKPKRQKPKWEARGSLDEMKTYAASHEMTEEDARYCYCKWESNGWRINRQPIVSWQHAMIAWRDAGYIPSRRAK